MTNLLAEVLQEVSKLSADRQEDAAHLLLAILENDVARPPLSEEQLRDLEFSNSEADAGYFATDKEIGATLFHPWA